MGESPKTKTDNDEGAGWKSSVAAVAETGLHDPDDDDDDDFVTCWQVPATAFSSTMMDDDRLVSPGHVGGWEGITTTRKDWDYRRHPPV